MHINYLPQHDYMVRSFMENNDNKYIICNEHLRDLSLDIDMEDEQKKKEAINKITELISIILKNKNLKEYIWNNYRNLNDEEKNKVYLEAKYLLDNKESFIMNTIYNKLVEFIGSENLLNIDGFFRFRMKDFIMAALPWVVMGIAIAVLAVNFSKKANNKAKDDVDINDSESEEDNYMALGMCLGMCMGCALSSAGVFSISYGISFGMLIGMAIGSTIKKSN